MDWSNPLHILTKSGVTMGKKLNEAAFLVVTVTLGFYGLTFLTFLVPIPSPAKDVLLVLLGYAGAKFGTVVDYHFGSSQGSARKTALLGAKEEKKDEVPNP